MLCGIGLRFKLLGGDAFGRVSDKGSYENREQPVTFKRPKPLAASIMPAAVQRSAVWDTLLLRLSDASRFLRR